VRQSLAANPAAEGSEYKIYAPNLKDPYNRRRIKCAEDLYGTVGIPRENKMARLMQFARNFDFYGAPVGMILSIDPHHGAGAMGRCRHVPAIGPAARP
jgi:hypothetical protein